MTDQSPPNKPEEVLRDGAIKSTIWRNRSAEGKEFFSATLTKTWQDPEGKYHDSTNFSGNDLLRVSELSRQSHNKIVELNRGLNRERTHQPAPERR